MDSRIIIKNGEIALADIIVNAANGCGWMGGKRCRAELHRGVAEHINYYSNHERFDIPCRSIGKSASLFYIRAFRCCIDNLVDLS